ncbi:hypothetical protein ACQWU4_19465 [Chryseobacterium sp. MIQD13]|uniref:hypothetical protein n=1 Tax=Chryseobacterium sp. MIQD13 TaxID=3422310 RepID=UPI003D2DA633
MKKIILFSGLLFLQYSFGQVAGIGTAAPKATLDVAAFPDDFTKKDGIIAPKLTGDDLKKKDALYTPSQDGAIVYVTNPVSSPSTKTKDVISPDYFFYNTKISSWQKLNPEPWYLVDTSYPAILNNQDIYHMGNVKILHFNDTNTIPKPYASLYVSGYSNVGTPYPGIENSPSVISGSLTVGSSNLVSSNSSAFGQNNTISGYNGLAVGDSNTLDNSINSIAVGDNNQLTNAITSFISGTGNKTNFRNVFIFGTNNTSGTIFGVTIGDSNTAGVNGTIGFAMGTQNMSYGLNTMAAGTNLIAKHAYMTAIGKYNNILESEKTVLLTSLIFQVGIGDSDTNRQNALSIYKDGSLQVNQLKGSQNTYACLDSDGNLFKSTAPCVP